MGLVADPELGRHRGLAAGDPLGGFVADENDQPGPLFDTSGVFAPPVPVPDGAELRTRLLAALGRRVG